jgi:hypothetical protein
MSRRSVRYCSISVRSAATCWISARTCGPGHPPRISYPRRTGNDTAAWRQRVLLQVAVWFLTAGTAPSALGEGEARPAVGGASICPMVMVKADTEVSYDVVAGIAADCSTGVSRGAGETTVGPARRATRPAPVVSVGRKRPGSSRARPAARGRRRRRRHPGSVQR